MKHLFTLLFIFLCFFSFAQFAADFSDQRINGPWQLPVGIIFDEQGQGYIWDMLGQVYILDENDQVLRTPLIDLGEEVAKWLDHGLVGFALDPNFSHNGYLYLLYPVDMHYHKFFGTPDYDPRKTETHRATFGRITRYTADKRNQFRSIVPDSRKVLVGKTPADGFPILFDSHGLGSLVFGNDGSLLASCGDGASSISVDLGSDPKTYFQQGLDEGIISEKENIGSFRSQLLHSLNGKIIRIDPQTGDGLPSNPFYEASAPRSAASRVWTLGLRNPYRFIVIPETGSHYIGDGDPGVIVCGDVGENTWEELNTFKYGGQNAGWPIYEGFDLTANYSQQDVVNFYAPNQDSENCNLPFFYFRHLLTKDALEPERPRHPCFPEERIPTSIPAFSHHRPAIVYQNQNETSEPYTLVSAFDTEGNAIALPIDDEHSPVEGAHFQGDASMAGVFYTSGELPEKWHHTLFQMDYQGWIRTYQMDENYNITQTEPFFTESAKIVGMTAAPDEAALYFLSLEDRKLHKLEYGGLRRPIADFSMDTLFGTSPLTVQFDASNSQGFNSPIRFDWDFGEGQVATDQQVTKTFTSTGQERFDVTLTVTDTFGNSSSLTKPVFINNTPPEIEILSPLAGEKYPIHTTSLIQLEAIAQDAESPESTLDFDWQIFLHHDAHFHPSGAQRGNQTAALLSPLGCGEEDYWYRILLKVSDPLGLAQERTVLLFPNCDTPLASDFQLRAIATETEIELRWDIDHFAEIVHFEIERSEDFFNFQEIGKTNADIQTFTDQVSHKISTFAYRVKAVYRDGAFQYSNIISRDFPVASTYRLFPNPATDKVFLDISDIAGNSFDFLIYDVQGREVFRQREAIHPEPSALYEFSLGKLPNGVYFYRIIAQNRSHAGKLFLR